jgi:hypothetical protein
MRPIGCGLEYRVYDQGDGRVLKVRRGVPGRILTSFLYSIRSGRLAGWPAILRILVLPVTNGVPALVLRLSAKSPETRRLFGNIEIVKGNDYAQDRVTPLGDYLASHSVAENLAIIADYVRLINSLWSVGVGDPYYSFLSNAGVYADGSVVQIDVADLVGDGAILEDTVRRQVWLSTGISGIEDEILRTESARLLNAGLAHEVFLERWREAKPAYSAGTTAGFLGERTPGVRGKRDASMLGGSSVLAGMVWAKVLQWLVGPRNKPAA